MNTNINFVLKQCFSKKKSKIYYKMGTSEERNILGQRFQNKRLELGLTTEQIADSVGVKQTTILKIEKGLFAWDIDLHIQLCKVLNLQF